MTIFNRDLKTGKIIKGLHNITKLERDNRFWNYVELIPFNECWIWMGPISDKGYGKFHIGDHKYIAAHRYSFAMKENLQKGLVIDHKCRNRACVNPRHLRQVSSYVNSMENSLGVGALNKIKTHCKYGHEFNEDNTSYNCNGGRYCKTCNKERKYRK